MTAMDESSDDTIKFANWGPVLDGQLQGAVTITGCVAGSAAARSVFTKRWTLA